MIRYLHVQLNIYTSSLFQVEANLPGRVFELVTGEHRGARNVANISAVPVIWANKVIADEFGEV